METKKAPASRGIVIGLALGAVMGALSGFSELGFVLAPAFLGFVLGSIMESNLRRALIISLGNYWGAFTNSTLSTVLLAFSIGSIILSLVNNIKKGKALI